MIKNLISKLLLFFLISSALFFLQNCEPNGDNLGTQFLENTAAQGVETQYDVIAYNVNNNDSIQSDATKLTTAVLGAFTESKFGMQKSSYVSQVRLNSYDPSFGTNAIVDSVVLTLKPLYASDSVTTTTVDNYVYPDGNIASKKVVNTYPVLKYGKAKINTKTIFNIKVHEVSDFLNSYSDKVYSNKTINYSTLLGSKVFDGTVNSIKITKNSDNTEITDATRVPSLRIPLSTSFFQNKMIAAQGSADLKDAASFIRYFRGIRISVDETDGYFFKFNPNEVVLTMYYKYDKVDNGVTTRPQLAYSFNLTTGVSNAHIGLVEFDRTGSDYESAIAVSNNSTGDEKLYAQGMGGPGIGIRIPNSVITELKNKFNNEKIGIMSAKIRLYTDVTSWSNTYEKPQNFVVKQRDMVTPKDLTTFLPDMSTLAYAYNFQFVKPYVLNNNPVYDITITKSLKDVVETNTTNYDFIINIGSYVANTSGTLAGQEYTSRVFTPNRAVFVGTTNSNNDKRASLQIIYGKK